MSKYDRPIRVTTDSAVDRAIDIGMEEHMIAVLNPRSGAGSALRKWRDIQSTVRQLIGPFEVIFADYPGRAALELEARLDRGETRLIAAGGDGTVNMLVGAIMQHDNRESIKLGAIGLGSSNDFHKPRNGNHRIGGAPYRLNFDATVRHDVGLLTYDDEHGVSHSRHWVLNASIGTTAEANWLFNNPDRVLRLLKRVSADAAIAYAAIKTVALFRPSEFVLTVDDGDPMEVRLKNLGVVKNPNFTGSLRYDSPYDPSSGDFFVHLLGDVSGPRLVSTLLGLTRGSFCGRKGTRSWRARQLSVRSDTPFAVEGDGEVIVTRSAVFSLVPNSLQVCRQ
jgi:diacylglycerol kinase family enzyme